mgnify:CR=1 FL=1
MIISEHNQIDKKLRNKEKEVLYPDFMGLHHYTIE